MEWLTHTLYWYIHLFVLGIVFLPLTKRLFPRFYDHGYPFSKTIGIIVVSYLAFVLGVFKLVPFSQISLYAIIAVCAAANVYIYLKDKDRGDFIHGSFSKQFLFLFQEVLFIGALLFLAYIRGQEPSIHGLEKFMDFGFMNSILRSVHFPPLDMWYSAGPDVNGVEHANGYPINYYYFGHLTGAMLIKLTGIPSYIGYNLILATILAQGMTLAFSLVANIVQLAQAAVYNHIKKHTSSLSITTYLFGILGSYILNFGGNLHTIYVFTRGYENESPVPFWQLLDSFNPTKYWYPNATRFIPYTIHEFPSYSYVVADLHGHVFDIPFVLLTLAILFHFFYTFFEKAAPAVHKKMELKEIINDAGTIIYIKALLTIKAEVISKRAFPTVILGFMCAIHYMTNAFDGPIYLLLSSFILLLVYKVTFTYFIHLAILLVSYVVFSLPFTAHFSLFVSGVGVNCTPNFLFTEDNIAQSTSFKVGPFLFEKGNCQRSAPWMMFVLWGLFLLHFLILAIIKIVEKSTFRKTALQVRNTVENLKLSVLDAFVFIIFLFGIFLIFIPEFFYVKDIYPAHFRANTMFKMGYQAYMMMSIACMYVIYRVKVLASDHPIVAKLFAMSIFLVFIIILQLSPEVPNPERTFRLENLFLVPFILLIFLIILYRREVKTVLALIFIYIIVNAVMLVGIYPFFSFPSYYTNLQKTEEEKQLSSTPTSLNGIEWLKSSNPEDLELITYINKNIPGQPVILEAQGDSYTDHERISSYTGVPTVAGWWVHEWLWRGSSDVVGQRIGDVATIYESVDIARTKALLKKYHVKYVVISQIERKKYPNLNQKKFDNIGKKIFESSNGFGALYQLN